MLIDPEPSVVDNLFKVSLEPARQSQQKRSQRLRAARVLAGFATAKSAASALGIQNFTYVKHENGQNGIRDELLEFYAGWFGVEKEWLSTGRLPTGLGSGIDRAIGQVLKDPATYVSVAEKPLPRTPFEDVSELPTGRPPSQDLIVPDYVLSVLEASRMDFSILKPTGLIRLPSTGPSQASLFAVHADEKRHRFDKGARIFIARSSWAHGASEYLIWDGRFLAIEILDRPLENSSSLTIIGRVIGRLEDLASD